MKREQNKRNKIKHKRKRNKKITEMSGKCLIKIELLLLL